MRNSALCSVLLLAFAGCTKFEITSTYNPGVPAALLGVWEGSWVSTGAQSGSGTISVRVQDFEGDPVVAVVLDNPCVVPQTFVLTYTGATIELRAAGATFLRAELADERLLAGVYGCPQDSGTWSAAWQGDLPEILDLSGEWIGSVQSASDPGNPLLLDLGQRTQGGAVVLQGALQLPEFMPLPVPVFGHAHFREQQFDVVLSTTSGVLPSIQLVGSGDPVTRSIQQGVMLVSGGVGVPFASGVWAAAQTPQ